MLLIRDIMYCKPGKVRALVEKFSAMSKLNEKRGLPRMRIMTDVAAERYWTVVSEMEVPSIDSFMSMMQNPDDAKVVQINTLKALKGSDFEVVRMTGIVTP